MRKIYVVGNGFKSYANWMQGVVVNDINEANLVLFAGGEDVCPTIYGEPIGSKTYYNLKRDESEVKVFTEAKRLRIPCVGICRGSQFLGIMSGGRLVQHQNNPYFIHPIKTHDDKTLLVSSTHHQAQYPYDMKEGCFKLLGWTEGISEVHLDGEDKEISKNPFKEAEIVYYPKSDCLAIQSHPEMLFNDVKYTDTIEYLQRLLDKFLNKEL